MPPPLSASQQKREAVPTRRWPVWMPWAVVGAGAIVTGVGGGLYATASSKYESFDKKFSAWCPNGCDESEVPSLSDQLNSARALETTSRLSLIAGGVTMAAGVALVFLNRSTESMSERVTARTFVAPTLGPETVGIAAGISF
jgi:ABC-type Fe3+ transport system permease subunit